MKSYFLNNMAKPEMLAISLAKVLPGQERPWLLHSSSNDVMAYFDIIFEEDGLIVVQADISGRHYDCDEMVLEKLREVANVVGGIICDDK